MSTLRAAVVAARDRLRAAGIDDAQIEAEVLLRHALAVVASTQEIASAVSRAELYTRFEDELSQPVEAAYASFLARRLAHEPSAYITCHREFWGLEFAVTPAVLIPRPETEGLLEAVLRELGRAVARTMGLGEPLNPVHPSTDSGRTEQSTARRHGRLRIADVGTGSGAIAVVLAKELPDAEVHALDASREALTVAAQNARRYSVQRRLTLRSGHLLTPLHDYVDCIVANLPYVSTGEWAGLQPEVREHEPRRALDGGADGLDLIRELLHQAPRYLLPGGFVALEIGEEQAAALGRFVEGTLPGATWRVEQDFAGKDRYFLVRPRS